MVLMRTEFEKFSKSRLNRSKWYRKISPKKFTSFRFYTLYTINKNIKWVIF